MTPEELLSIAETAAQEAGAILNRYFRGPLRTELKGEGDIVSEADLASEHALLSTIRRHCPDHRIVSEEAGDSENPSDYTWYVDPLDGTRNFARGLPLFCVSIGVAYRGQIVAAVIRDPAHEETITAARGRGLLVDGRPARVSAVTGLAQSVLATGYPSPRRHRDPDPALLLTIASRTQGIRRSGSSALDLAWLAAGRIDAYWDTGLRSWDVAAGWLLVEEAGGRVTDRDGDPWGLHSPDLVATNGHVHEELVGLLQSDVALRR